MSKKRTYIVEDDKIVIDIMYDELQVLALEELKEQIKEFGGEVRNVIGDLMGEVNFNCFDLDRQIFFVPYVSEDDAEMFAIAVQLEGKIVNEEVVFEWFKKKGFKEVD